MGRVIPPKTWQQGYIDGKADSQERIAELEAELQEAREHARRVVQWFTDNGQKLPMDSAPDCVRCLDALLKEVGDE